ncbi:MAG: hypothetical protein ACOC0B_00715 [bacterium]
MSDMYLHAADVTVPTLGAAQAPSQEVDSQAEAQASAEQQAASEQRAAESSSSESETIRDESVGRTVDVRA